LYDEREEKKEGAKLMRCEMLTCHCSEKKSVCHVYMLSETTTKQESEAEVSCRVVRLRRMRLTSRNAPSYATHDREEHDEFTTVFHYGSNWKHRQESRRISS
jgi:hypothetical protein